MELHDFCCLCLASIPWKLRILLCPEVWRELIADEDTACENVNVSSVPGSLTDVTTARRRSTWSLTSRSTNPRTQHPTSPARSAIKGSPASPASSRISCCTRRRRSVTSQPSIKKKTCGAGRSESTNTPLFVLSWLCRI